MRRRGRRRIVDPPARPVISFGPKSRPCKGGRTWASRKSFRGEERTPRELSYSITNTPPPTQGACPRTEAGPPAEGSREERLAVFPGTVACQGSQVGGQRRGFRGIFAPMFGRIFSLARRTSDRALFAVPGPSFLACRKYHQKRRLVREQANFSAPPQKFLRSGGITAGQEIAHEEATSTAEMRLSSPPFETSPSSKSHISNDRDHRLVRNRPPGRLVTASQRVWRSPSPGS